MSEFNKTYRIRTQVGQDTTVKMKLDQEYDTLEILSLKIDQVNAYRLHTANYGVIAGRVLANGAMGIPNAKVSIFINRDDEDSESIVKAILYPYNTTFTKNNDGVKYNLLPDEQISTCHTIIGTFPGKQFLLDNDNVLEIFEKYYKFTTRTNAAGDYMIFGVPTGSQTLHVDIDLSDIGILSQKPRDLVYKGYNINQFENPNKFKHDTNLTSLAQVITQDNIIDVVPFWGDESETTIGITRADIEVQYKFEPTCVFMGSVVSDTASSGISKKCIPSNSMGAMDEITTGTGTIEIIRKKPDGNVEEFQIQGTQLINGDGVWCFQIPMNLDYMMTDEFGNMVPTNDPAKGIPTRTRVRFRISMQDFETDNSNIFRCKMLVPNNPSFDEISSDGDIDYQFGTATREESYKDLYWNGVYTVKSYIPRVQKGENWRNERFTGFKRVNYYGDKNPIPYNNIRIKIPFMYTIICALVKMFIKIVALLNGVFKLIGGKLIGDSDGPGGAFIALNGSLCNDNLENLCIVPGVDLWQIVKDDKNRHVSLLGNALLNFANELGANVSSEWSSSDSQDTKSIDYNNSDYNDKSKFQNSVQTDKSGGKDDNYWVYIYDVNMTSSTDYLIQCIEMNLAQEYRVIQFDFYNDWINGLVYIPRWFRNITKKHTFFWGAISFGGKVKACNSSFKGGRKKRNIVQQCGLTYKIQEGAAAINSVKNPIGCNGNSLKKQNCHKNKSVRLSYPIFKNGGIVHDVLTLKNQYVYYFKPCEYTYENGVKKVVRLFATDIVLLGTLNDCDKWGIPNELSELRSSTYQMPTNMALTDSDIEGSEYESKNASNTVISLKVKNANKGKFSKMEQVNAIKGINVMEEDGNYTELAGIEWGYTGPLQNVNLISNAKNDSLYTPGGHFLGLTCRNSQTTIKTCVNLSRVCEHGVWMSQRQELNIPNSATTVTDSSAAFLNYATVPTGFISKDEISDTNFRRTFATMNQNKLKTRIDEETGYPVYDFIYINPTNFGGELKDFIHPSGGDTQYNRLVASTVNERYFDYSDNDYYEQTENKSLAQTVTEKQITRANEVVDKEYLKFRFGWSDEDLTNINKRKNNYLIYQSGEAKFPIYENSFYFYFGLRDGATALDEFKKQYYAVCESTNDLVQLDSNMYLSDLQVEMDGVCENVNAGSIKFKVNASDIIFGTNGVNVKLLNGGRLEQEIQGVEKGEIVEFTSLKNGPYTIVLSNNEGKENMYEIYIDKIDLKATLKGVDFIKDVSSDFPSEIIAYPRVGPIEEVYGGYIYIPGNMFEYVGDTFMFSPAIVGHDKSVDLSVFESYIVEKMTLVGYDEDGIEYHTTVVHKENEVFGSNTQGNTGRLYRVEMNGAVGYVNMDDNGNYIIPVPDADLTYHVYLHTYMTSYCKPIAPSLARPYSSTWKWKLGEVHIKNATPLDISYNTIQYSTQLKDAPVTQDKWWWENKGIWQGIDNKFQWLLKENLYMGNIDKTHSVHIEGTGGVAPYVEEIWGKQEDANGNLSAYKMDLMSTDLLNVNIPTENYSVSRDVFKYIVHDYYHQSCPETPKTFFVPVVYKPFFIESVFWYMNSNDKFYVTGDVFNGKTWDYVNEGFNACSLNYVDFAKLVNIKDPDQHLEMHRRYGTNGGYGYPGPEYEHNARISTVESVINSETYAFKVNDPVDIRIQVGCHHKENVDVYEDSTYCEYRDARFCQFSTVQGEDSQGVYIQLDPSSSSYWDFYQIQDGSSSFKYPFTVRAGNKYTTIPDFSDTNLYDAIMENNIRNGSTKIDDLGSKKYYVNSNSTDKFFIVALPSDMYDNTESIVSENRESKIRCASISNIIDLSELAKFYPLKISIKITDAINAEGKATTTLEVTALDGSGDNFKNKTLTISFVKVEGDSHAVLYSQQISTGNKTSITVDITGKRVDLGITDDDSSQSLYYFYNASYYDNGVTVSAPATYGSLANPAGSFSIAKTRETTE